MFSRSRMRALARLRCSLLSLGTSGRSLGALPWACAAGRRCAWPRIRCSRARGCGPWRACAAPCCPWVRAGGVSAPGPLCAWGWGGPCPPVRSALQPSVRKRNPCLASTLPWFASCSLCASTFCSEAESLSCFNTAMVRKRTGIRRRAPSHYNGSRTQIRDPYDHREEPRHDPDRKRNTQPCGRRLEWHPRRGEAPHRTEGHFLAGHRRCHGSQAYGNP